MDNYLDKKGKGEGGAERRRWHKIASDLPRHNDDNSFKTKSIETHHHQQSITVHCWKKWMPLLHQD